MCGIIAYIGKKDAYSSIINGLKKLEYRGYDSSGIALMNGQLSLHKKKGDVQVLESYMSGKSRCGNIGLGHTRWATHGIPSDSNAHPHQSTSRRFTIVHNGIIENFTSLKNMLVNEGFTFQSDTDSEVLVQLIEWHQKKYNLNTHQAITRSLDLVEGSYAFVLFDLNNPDQLWACRKQSPLVIGIGKKENFIASDILAFNQEIEQVIYLPEETLAHFDDQGNYSLFDNNLTPIEPQISRIKKSVFSNSKDGYESFMLKEIFEQPKAIENLISKLETTNLKPNYRKIIITACGTSWHSGYLAKRLIESQCRIHVSLHLSSEYRHSQPIINEDDLMIAISQSGETADTIAALEMAKAKNCPTLGIVNVKQSTIDRMCDQSFYLNVGPEIGVASTKAFTGQYVSILHVVSSLLKAQGNASNEVIDTSILNISDSLQEALDRIDVLKISRKLENAKSTIFLGRGMMHPIALEGALKLKEISYIHAEGFAAGELKHGPIALIDHNMPVIALCHNDRHLPKMISNVQEVKARGGIIIMIKTDDVQIPPNLADVTLSLPNADELIAPIIFNLPLQLIAHQVSKAKNLNVDRPRNLAKSVTVE